MKKLIILFWLAILFSTTVSAQKEFNNWFFGKNAGLNFNTSPPSFLPGGNVVSSASSSSISDEQGNLLFYSDGVTVWNRDHVPMPNGNGLMGNTGSSQTVLITYYPGNKNFYYIFTVEKGGDPNGLRYSIIDIRLDGGRGDVIQKNEAFNLPVTEKLTAVKHKNGQDFWLITHAYNTDIFFVYHIDCTGKFNPKTYFIGSVISTPLNARGYLKASPDGSKLVSANFGGDFELFDFDSETGVISNLQVLPATSGNGCGPFGVEFSPDSKLLYVSESYTCSPVPQYTVLQYKLDPDEDELVNSRVIIDAGMTNLAGALQLGPDNKIYIAYDNAPFLGVISNPNAMGRTEAGFSKQNLLQAPASGTFGLPNILAGFQRKPLTRDTTLCEGQSLVLKTDFAADNYLWNDNSFADTLLVTKTGKYWVNIITTNEEFDKCTITDTVNVVFGPGPPFSLPKDTLLCQDKFPFVLAPTLPAGNYLWQDGSTAATFSAQTNGEYWLQVTANGCSSRDSIKIDTAPITSFTLGADTTICAGTILKLTPSLPAATYLWNNGSTANTVNADTAGVYWCEVKYANGCGFRDSIRITVLPLPAFSLGNDTAICASPAPLVLRATVSGSSYTWQDGSTASTFPVTATGKYWVNVANNGCSASDTINVTVNPSPLFTLGADTIICGIEPLVLTVSPGFSSYRWNTGSTANAINIGTTTGQYWCEVTNSSGCTYRDTIAVTFKAPPGAWIGKDTSLCPSRFPYVLSTVIPGASYLWKDGSTASTYAVTTPGTYWVAVTVNNCVGRDTVVITAAPTTPFNLGADTVICTASPYLLTVNPAFTSYRWSNGATTRSIAVTSSGRYWCEASNGTGCTSADTINVTINNPPVVNLGNDSSLCPNEFPFVLTQPSIPGAVYQWSTGATTNSITINSAGKYWLNVNLNGCSSSDTINISSASVNAFSLGADTVVCTATPYLLTVNPAFSTYRWSTGATTRSIAVTATGEYWCQVTSAGGCSSSDTVFVTLKTAPVVNLGRDTVLCQNQFPFILGQPSTGASYLWQNGSTASNFSATGPGRYWVQASVNGCSAADTINIGAGAAPVFTLGRDTTICSGNQVTLTVNPAFASYRWSNGATSRSITVNTAGTYWCQVANSQGCTSSDTIVVNVTPAPVVNLGRDTTVCTNAFPIVLGRPIPGAAFLWQDGQTGATYQVTRPGTYSVEVSANGCSSRDTIIVNASQANSLSLGPDTTICAPASFTITANTAAGSYLWNTGSTARSITVNSTGLYWCEINPGTGCGARDSIRVTVVDAIDFTLGKDTLICDNRSLLLDLSNKGDSYTWQDNSTAAQFNVTRSGTYYVTVRKASCVKSDTVVVNYGTPVVPNLGSDKTICPGEEILLDANVQADNYLWQDGSTGRTLRVMRAGTYSVQVSNSCGRNTDEIIIAPGGCRLMVPNAFTPGKNPNGVFRILNAQDLKDFNLKVFSRWGQQVFETSKPLEGWDGRYNGLEQPVGTYVYQLSYTDPLTGKKESQKGTVVIVR